MRDGKTKSVALRGLAAAALLATLGGAAPGGALEVSVAGLRSAKGMVSACLTRDPARFPKCQHDPAALRFKRAAGDRTPIRFTAVPSGSYALAILHDENGNGKLDTALMGIPKEGFGFSRNPKVAFGPPRFRAAAFPVANTPLSQNVKMRYFF